MGVVFVLTDKGWKDEASVTTDNMIYCYDCETCSLDVQRVDTIVDVSKYDTYKVYNRNVKFGTYCNAANDLVVLNTRNRTSLNVPLTSVASNYYQFDVSIPSRIDSLSPNIRKTTLSLNEQARFDKDVKLRDIGTFHFDLDRPLANLFVERWRKEYQRLNAVDYNQALMLQLVVLKGGKLSTIEREIGFNINVFDKSNVTITDVVKSEDVHITKRFMHNNKQLHCICHINGSVVIC